VWDFEWVSELGLEALGKRDLLPMLKIGPQFLIHTFVRCIINLDKSQGTSILYLLTFSNMLQAMSIEDTV